MHKLSIFWFKRDLRILDNEGLQGAIDKGIPLLLLYIFEPNLERDPHYHSRHQNFIEQSLNSL